MKQFKFAQQRLLNVREQQRRLLETRVALALSEWKEATVALQVAEQDLEKISNRVAKREHVDVVQTYQSVPAVQRQIVLTRQRLVESFARLEQAREKIRQMSVAVESLDKARGPSHAHGRSQQGFGLDCGARGAASTDRHAGQEFGESRHVAFLVERGSRRGVAPGQDSWER